MLECHRCGSVMSRYGEPHECYPSEPCRASYVRAAGAITGTNVGFWEEHNRRMKVLAAANPNLSVGEVAGLALAPPVAMAKVA